jgi:hypothetical protein
MMETEKNRNECIQSLEMGNQDTQYKSTTKMGFTGVCHLEVGSP